MTPTALRISTASARPVAATVHVHISEASTDQDVQDALLGRQEEALSEAYRRFGQKVYRTAFGVLRRSELAEDVTQEVFVRLWQRRVTGGGQGRSTASSQGSQASAGWQGACLGKRGLHSPSNHSASSHVNEVSSCSAHSRI